MSEVSVAKGDRFVRYSEVEGGGKMPSATYVVVSVDKNDPEKVMIRNADPSVKKQNDFPNTVKKLKDAGYVHEKGEREPAAPIVEAKAVTPVIEAAKSPIPRYRAELLVPMKATLLNGKHTVIAAGRIGDAYYSQGHLYFEPNTREEDERCPFPVNADELKILGVDQGPQILADGEDFDETGSSKMPPPEPKKRKSGKK